MHIKREKTLSQIVTKNLKAAEILENHNIDFCCGGERTLGEACREQNVSIEAIQKELDEVEGTDSEASWINNMELSELADHIVKRHHSYIRESIPYLKDNLVKIVKVHGDNHPELYEVKREFEQAAEALTNHMAKEENILFPYIRQMTNVKENKTSMAQPDFGTIKNPLSQMLNEHETEGERFDRLAEITDNFKVPDDGCTMYKLTYSRLKEFKLDLHKHIHLENNMLFPGAEMLEEEIVKSSQSIEELNQ